MTIRACVAPVCAVLSLALGGCASQLTLDTFIDPGSFCYDRSLRPQTAVVDAHLHARPFGGQAPPFEEVVSYLESNGVLFATVMGIGQTLPETSACRYYTRCPGTPVAPTMRSDLANAAAYVAGSRPGIRLTLSMTFADLARPETILPGMQRLDAEYPGVFRWMGEVNLVKQALFANGHEAVAAGSFGGWADFMALLRERGMPLSIHADLGNDRQPTAYLGLIEAMLAAYPDNSIVWMHMGLSRELTAIDPVRHVEILKSLLDRYPRLMLDLSWRVIDDHYFSDPNIRAVYVPFLNDYSKRLLPGSDFLASRTKTSASYAEDLRVTSRIYRYLNDTAFRDIALGENYFRLLGLDYSAPPVCNRRP